MRARKGEWIRLMHPESPGIWLWVQPSFLRRIGIVRSGFATIGETTRAYRTARKNWKPSSGLRF